MKLFLLSKENLALSRAEAERLHGRRGTLLENFLFLDVGEWKPGLAFTRSIHELLFEVKREKLLDAARSFPWERHVESPFAVEGNDVVEEKSFAGLVWHSLEDAHKNPSVDLERPKTLVALFSISNHVYVVRREWENRERFFDRRAHLRPRNHPTSLNPKLARAMINLAGGNASSILDPFCGAGGILLEGALANRSMTGVDIDPEQVARAEENLDFFGADATLTVGNASVCDALGRFDAIVTDLPIGKNAKLVNGKETFVKFFKAAGRVTENLIVAVDSSFPIKECFGSWRKICSFDWYLHKNFVKRIFVLKYQQE